VHANFSQLKDLTLYGVLAGKSSTHDLAGRSVRVELTAGEQQTEHQTGGGAYSDTLPRFFTDIIVRTIDRFFRPILVSVRRMAYARFHVMQCLFSTRL
jgi:hypothetical protein